MEQQRMGPDIRLMAPAAQPMGSQGLLARLALSDPPPPEATLPPRPGYTEARNATELRPQDVGGIGRNYLAQMAGLAPSGVAANTIMGFTGAATINARNVLQGIRAYHGSPHRFDRFDMARIGTGEGAQAYGHGLYFAQSEDVARSYRDALANNPGNTPNSIAQYWVANSQGDRRAAAAALNESIESWRANPMLARDRSLQAMLTRMEDARPLIETANPVPGSMYEVNLRVDPNRLLDWDAPLSAQPQGVRQSVRDAAAAYRKNYAGRGRPMTTDDILAGRLDNYTGSDGLAAVGGMAPGATGAEASTLLRDAGVQGIRYLDQGSRATAGGDVLGVTQGNNGWQARIRVDNRGGARFASPTQQITTSRPFPTQAEAQAWADSQVGGGTRNYVMFDDSLVDIVRRYGLAGLLGGGGAAAAAGGAEASAP